MAGRRTFRILTSSQQSGYLTENTSLFRYKDQSDNAVQGNIRCLFWQIYGTYICILYLKYVVGYVQ